MRGKCSVIVQTAIFRVTISIIDNVRTFHSISFDFIYTFEACVNECFAEKCALIKSFQMEFSTQNILIYRTIHSHFGCELKQMCSHEWTFSMYKRYNYNVQLDLCVCA